MDAETLSLQLKAKIQEIKGTLAEAKATGFPLNEANTEAVIIRPLLESLGYSPLQIHIRGHDSVANNFPDYTLLPGTPHKWFLEVKKFDLPLKDGEAAQSVSYANHQGVDWAVLTNGRSWYVYNAYLRKPLSEKRVMYISDLFSDDDAIEKLQLLTRQSMQNGGLTSAWTYQQVASVVKSQFTTPSSAIREHLKKIAQEAIGANIDDVMIGKAITAFRCMSEAMGTVPTGTPAPNASIAPREKSASPDDGPIAQEPTVYTFAEIGNNTALATGQKPQAVIFSDGSKEQVTTWADAARIVVEHLAPSYGLPPLPFKSGIKGNNYFLNAEQKHGKGNPMLGHRVAQVDNTQVYVDTNRGAAVGGRAGRLRPGAHGGAAGRWAWTWGAGRRRAPASRWPVSA